MGERSLAGFQDHHIIPKNSEAYRAIQRAFRSFQGYSWSPNSRPVARVLLPSSTEAVAALGNVSRHAGGHGSYTAAIDEAVRQIIRDYGHDPVALSDGNIGTLPFLAKMEVSPATRNSASYPTPTSNHVPALQTPRRPSRSSAQSTSS